MGSNALIAYDETNATNATTATMEGYEKEVESQNFMITRQFEREMEKNQLRNLGVLKTNSGNAAKRKTKIAETRHGAKERSTSLTTLKMIAMQKTHKKSQLENKKTDLLNKLTSEIAQIHKTHNIAMEAQRKEMKNQREQFQFEIYVLGERIWELEMEGKESTQERLRRSESIEELAQEPTCGSDIIQKSSWEEFTQPSQTPPIKPKQQRIYAMVTNAKLA